jgi:hypothetical protein
MGTWTNVCLDGLVIGWMGDGANGYWDVWMLDV